MTLEALIIFSLVILAMLVGIGVVVKITLGKRIAELEAEIERRDRVYSPVSYEPVGGEDERQSG